MNTKRKQLWLDIVNAASQHGEESEPEMEVGDLQQALSIALRCVPTEKLDQLRNDLGEIFEWASQSS